MLLLLIVAIALLVVVIYLVKFYYLAQDVAEHLVSVADNINRHIEKFTVSTDVQSTSIASDIKIARENIEQVSKKIIDLINKHF
jgi:uncharacterized protein YoxC